MSTLLTILVLVTTTFEMKADGHDRIIPISDDAILAIKIGLVMLAIGVIFLFASLLRSFVRKRNLPEPKSYFLIVLVTLLIAGIWNWIVSKMNPSDILGLAITPISILILFFVPILLYRISPKKKSKDHNSQI